MNEKKKVNWTETIAVGFLIIFVSLVTFSVTWWFMDIQVNEKQEASDQVRALMLSRINQYAEKIKLLEDATEPTQIYKGAGFTVNYPNTWVYRIYNGSSNNLVAFADSQKNLPTENSDQQAMVAITSSTNPATAKDLTSDPTQATSQNVTVANNLSATKWTLLGGRANDLNGESKVVIYEIKLKNGTFIRFQNVNDKGLAAFNKMLNSLQLT